MKSALFYEIPVARPWTRESEHRAYRNTLEQVVLGDRLGFHAFWTVEHHFLEEFSHCSNPEVLYGSVAAWLEQMKRELGTYECLKGASDLVKGGAHELLSFDYLKDSNAVIVGDPDEVVRRCKEYEAAGVDLLLCLVNPYDVPHEKVMQTIELMGKHVLPEFA